MTSKQLKNYFDTHHYTQKEILECIPLYHSNEFIKLIQTFDDYAVTITALHKKYKNASCFTKFYHLVNNSYYKGFTKRLAALNTQLQQELHRQKIQQALPSFQIAQILKNTNNYHDCAQNLEKLIKNTLQQNHHYNFSVDQDINQNITKALEQLYNPPSEQHFAFNLTLINHVLSDVDSLQHQRPTSDSPNLFKHALITFVTNLNPVTQISQWVDFIINAAHFTADITLGKLYLSDSQYQTRIDNFCDSLRALSWKNISQIPTEQWVEIGAQLAADCVYASGLTKVTHYLKKLETINCAQQNIAKTVTSFKESLKSTLARDNFIINSDGTIIKQTINPPPVSSNVPKRVIGHTIEQLKDIQQSLMVAVKKDLDFLRQKYNHTKKGFLDCINKYIKIDYRHILGMELSFSKKGLPHIDGFHIDHMNKIEKSRIIEFNNKAMYPDGFYSAQLLFNGKIAKHRATFFPAHWTNEQVVDAIFEAYNDFIKNGAKPKNITNNNYTLQGNISTGQVIEIICTRNGKIKTAYPNIREIKNMRYIKFSNSKRGYCCTSKTDDQISILMLFLTTDVGCPATEWDDWIYDDEKGLEAGGNITYLEKERVNIYMCSPYDYKNCRIPDDHSKKLKISRDNLAQLIEDWKEKVCKKIPQEVTITYENDTFTLTTSDDTQSSKKSKFTIFL